MKKERLICYVILAFCFLAFLSSCTKEVKEDCKDYQMFIESTEESAKNKCRGLANNHPEWKVIEVRVLPCLTEDQLFIAQATGRVTTLLYCPNVWFEIRTTIK